VKSPPKAENNLILQIIVRQCEELKIEKGCDYGVIASIMKEKQPQYPWLERGMILYMVKQLDTIVLLVEDKVNNLLRNRHNLIFAATLREMKEKKEYAWLDEPLVHTLYKKNKPQREHARLQILFLTTPPQIIRHGTAPNAQQQQPNRVVELLDISDIVAAAAILASLASSNKYLVMAQPITGRKHDDHSALSSSILGGQTTPLSSSNLGDQNSIQTTPSLNLVGRPTGTTIAAVFDRKQCTR
jgi:hypothetical protein